MKLPTTNLPNILYFFKKPESNDNEAKEESKSSEESARPGGEGRQQWSNSTEFLMSCIAMSVGLGNVWRFPFTAYENGGGAFLIPYMIVLFFVGRPLYFLELALGQFSSAGCVNVWSMVPAMAGVGYGQVGTECYNQLKKSCQSQERTIMTISLGRSWALPVSRPTTAR